MAKNSSDPDPNGHGTNGTGTRPRPPGPEAPRYRTSGEKPPGEKPDGGDRGPRRWLSYFARRWLWVLVGLLVLNWLLTPYLLPEPAQERLTVPYTTFKEQVVAGNVSEVTSRGDLIQGTFKQAVTYPPAGSAGAGGTATAGGSSAAPRSATQFETRVPVFANDSLDTLLEQNGVVISARPIQSGRSTWLSILLSFGPALLFFGLLMWMSTRAQRAQGNIFGIGRSRARRYDETITSQARITFADVAGID